MLHSVVISEERMQNLMTEEERLRRKALRRRPEMLHKAEKYGLLVHDDNWTVVTHKRERK